MTPSQVSLHPCISSAILQYAVFRMVAHKRWSNHGNWWTMHTNVQELVWISVVICNLSTEGQDIYPAFNLYMKSHSSLIHEIIRNIVCSRITIACWHYLIPYTCNFYILHAVSYDMLTLHISSNHMHNIQIFLQTRMIGLRLDLETVITDMVLCLATIYFSA